MTTLGDIFITNTKMFRFHFMNVYKNKQKNWIVETFLLNETAKPMKIVKNFVTAWFLKVPVPFATPLRYIVDSR